MTYNYIFFENRNPDYDVKAVNVIGDDTDLRTEQVKPMNNNNVYIGALGCPRAGTESDHWCWFYFDVYEKNTSNVVRTFSVFIRLADSGHLRELGIRFCSDKEDKSPPERNIRGDGGEGL